jgi:hypothetical protein
MNVEMTGRDMELVLEIEELEAKNTPNSGAAFLE